MVVDPSTVSAPTGPPRSEVRWTRRSIELHDPEVFGAKDSDLCLRFLTRVFAVEEVEKVRIDRPNASARIGFAAGRSRIADLLQKLASAIRGVEPDPTPESSRPRLLPRDLSGPCWTIHRHKGMLSTWEVVAERPGSMTLRHELIKTDPALARRIATALETAPGVLSSIVRLLSGTLRIRFEPAPFQAERLLGAVESATSKFRGTLTPTPEQPPVCFGLANTSLALAVVTDYVAPAIWPVTVSLLVGTNLWTFRDAVNQLRHGELGLSVLYSSIAVATLATGQFVPWAIMNWMTRYWSAVGRQRLVDARSRVLGQLDQRQFVRLVAPGGTEIDVPLDRVEYGDVILASAGETFPCDGRILDGYGLVDESIVRGATGLTRKQPDDLVRAGSLVVRGELRVETRASASPRRAAHLSEATLAATRQTPGQRAITLKGERFARRFVGPTLAAAGLGFMLGGPPMALAIMRPDFASGPGLGQSLEAIQACASFTRQGIVVRDLDALDRLAKIDVLLLEDLPALETCEIEVAGIRVFPGSNENQVLQYAACAIKDLDDERAPALREACRARQILMFDRLPIEFGADVTLSHRDRVIKVGNLGSRINDPERLRHLSTLLPATMIESLMVAIDGPIAGLIDFRVSERLKATAGIRQLRERAGRPLAIGLVSASERKGLPALAARLGVDFQRGGIGTNELVDLIRGCRARRLKVAYAGDCVHRLSAIREADLAISMTESGIDQLHAHEAPILLLEPDVSRLATLETLTRDYQKRLGTAQASSLIPNGLCVAGAFLLGFSSLATVVITNLGTLSTYARSTAAIGELEKKMKRDWLRSSKPPRSRTKDPV